jgi:hypothetical protein
MNIGRLGRKENRSEEEGEGRGVDSIYNNSIIIVYV